MHPNTSKITTAFFCHIRLLRPACPYSLPPPPPSNAPRPQQSRIGDISNRFLPPLPPQATSHILQVIPSYLFVCAYLIKVKQQSRYHQYPDRTQEKFLKKIYGHFDLLHMMSYDQHGRHSTLAFGVYEPG
jgi:hypothetical protein